MLASGSEDKTIKIWNAITGHLEKTLEVIKFDNLKYIINIKICFKFI